MPRAVPARWAASCRLKALDLVAIERGREHPYVGREVGRQPCRARRPRTLAAEDPMARIGGVAARVRRDVPARLEHDALMPREASPSPGDPVGPLPPAISTGTSRSSLRRSSLGHE